MLKKDIINKGNTHKVRFYTHPIPEAETAFLVGDFNDWDEDANPMSQLKDGRFKLVLKLDVEQSYQFRYLVDGEWHNDWEADRYVPNPYSGDNSVVIT